MHVAVGVRDGMSAVAGPATVRESNAIGGTMSEDFVDVASTDGTALSARITGSGSPLVLVHGTTGSKDSWALVEPLFAERHTVWSYDRRGRGQSGDGDEYSFELEVDDVRAVVAAAGEPAHVVGHSFGASLALEAAAVDPSFLTLVIYEPPLHGGRRAKETREGIRRLDAEDYEGGLLMFLSEVAGLSDDEVALVRSIPEVWSRMLDAAATVGREATAGENRPWNPTRFASVRAPTLHVSGSLTDSPIYPSSADVQAAIPHAVHAVLEGQRHIGFVTDPERFAEIVLDFTSSRGPS